MPSLKNEQIQQIKVYESSGQSLDIISRFVDLYPSAVKLRRMDGDEGERLGGGHDARTPEPR